MAKVLLISYYWPPAGGAGVQRWLKLTKYLSRMGVMFHVVTVDESKSSYQEIDEKLVSDIHPSIIVHKTDSFEPTNIYAKIAGKESVPTGGFSNVDNTRIKQKVVNAVRSNFFIPDPRVGWNNYAYRKASSIIKREKINCVITTSPPHSTQMIGLRLKKNFGIKWVVDMRDPWTDIYYYKLLMHSKVSHLINSQYEKSVFEYADRVVTVSKGFKELFDSKGYKLNCEIDVVTNGYDEEDFEVERNSIVKDTNVINLVYTGSVSDQYNPYALLEALCELRDEGEKKYKITFVGRVDTKIINRLDEYKLNYEYVSYVPHSEVVGYQLYADVLLLFTPDVKLSKGIIPGKVFEYIATKNPILCIGNKEGDLAEIVGSIENSKVLSYGDKEGIKEYLKGYSVERCETASSEKYSRSYQAKQYLDVIKNES